jgi:DNA-binding transcriptional MocR family regulator
MFQKNELIIGGNSSLNLMYDTLMRAMMFGTVDSDIPWSKCGKIKFLCPSPGYDRHFAMCEDLGIEMIMVSMTDEGPDMDQVERLVKEDELIKGIWCIPKYSNPTGITYSDDVVDRLASMKCAANDFRIMWDNAYNIHHLNNNGDELKDLLQACKKANNANRMYMFSSTSKVTFPGSGIAVMAMSQENADDIRKHMGYQTIGSNKINQLMHVRFLPTSEAIEDHMMKHAEILEPKFNKVLEVLEREIGAYNIARWNNPNGGYFINLDVIEGCAKEVVACCLEHGVTLTPAGATFPYGIDPQDTNIRIAPTFPPLSELELAIEVLATCIQYVSINKILQI